MARHVKTSGIVLMAIIESIANYHIGTCHNTSYSEVMLHVVEAFLGERIVNTPMHPWDLQALNNAVYV
jgi:hypothetical protein